MTTNIPSLQTSCLHKHRFHRCNGNPHTCLKWNMASTPNFKLIFACLDFKVTDKK